MRDDYTVVLHEHLADAPPLQIVFDFVRRDANAAVILAQTNVRLEVRARFCFTSTDPPQRYECYHVEDQNRPNRCELWKSERCLPALNLIIKHRKKNERAKAHTEYEPASAPQTRVRLAP